MFDSLLHIINQMSPYLLLGFFFAGVLHVYVPHRFYARRLGQNTLSAVLYAALFGIPLPLCSCGVIPTAVGLRKEGVSKGATVSFLIATPQTGVDSIMATYGVLGLPFAIIRPIAALVTALFGGSLVNLRLRRKPEETPEEAASPNTDKPLPQAGKVLEVFKYGFIDMLQDVGRWLAIGLVLAALIAVLVPDTFFARFAAWPIVNMLMVMAVSIPMYVCATGSIPIAAALILKGMTPGAALVLLMAGPATNMASLLVIRKVLGRATMWLYLAAIVAGAFAFGLGIDYLLPRTWFTQLAQTEVCCAADTPLWKWICTGVFLLLLANALVLKLIHKHRNNMKTDNETVYKVKGMSCNHCKMSVEKALSHVEGVEKAEADVAGACVKVTGHPALEKVKEAVEAIGFEFGGLMKIKMLLLLCCTLWLASCQRGSMLSVTPSDSDLTFSSLAPSWDEGIPLGNATVGALVWKNGDAMRFSLDRTDLWDLRPSDSLAGENFRFEWVKEHIRAKDYLPVQKKYDHPYDRFPAPSKIPGAALEISLEGLGEPTQVRLYLNNALCQVDWADGTQMQAFVHADKPVGWFVFKNVRAGVKPVLLPPAYDKPGASTEVSTSLSGQDLRRLKYEQGTITPIENGWVYHQPGYDDFSYDVAVQWEQRGSSLFGTWSVSSSLSPEEAVKEVAQALTRGVKKDYWDHMKYWDGYWAQSRVSLPDSVLQKQYQNEMYKFGSSSREHSYPISLQAVWTADNGELPPWKGDFHHDLNTQLSYWPAYAGNHLSEGLGYLNTLWDQRDTYKRYTKQYFGTDGMNIPGVATLTGEPMGGWIQYSLSQTVAAWLAQHFYLHWKYSADRTFLEERGYPFLNDVAVYLEQLSQVDAQGVRTLEFSSSPEIFDNSLQAWFHDMTNYDLALMRFLFGATAEMASALGRDAEAAHWTAVKAQLPDFDVDADGSLTFAKGFPYDSSHRHFSHAMAIHPLGLIDWSHGEQAQHIIRATLKKLQDYGPDYWTGYSYSWFAVMQARAFNGQEAANALRIFAECFCLPNTFHVNGDQSGTGKSRFTYRPFTLEGNFAFASGVQEMLIQSHTGVIRVFPAIPEDWNQVSFENLRAMGAFLVSATRQDGRVTRLRVFSEKGGPLDIVSPIDGQVAHYDTQPGQWIELI